QRTGSKGGARPPAQPPAVTPAVTPAAAPDVPPRGLLESGVGWLSQPFAFALVAVLVPFSWFKGPTTTGLGR
ncbi:MAG: hypothetical protein KGN76_09735, partial [Acidobacteriota bacterium]|nr:hypothetical protein [Acidobacteriota bacterium]